MRTKKTNFVFIYRHIVLYYTHLIIHTGHLLKEIDILQKSKLHSLQYDEGGNYMAETETETEKNYYI
jgi:hypothetical protein